MRLCFNNLLLAFSRALDYVEKDYFKVKSRHGKRVACLSLLMGEYLELNNEQNNDLVGYAILHDNGLTEYYKHGDKPSKQEFLKIHCEAGEDNITFIPFFHPVDNVIKYHHESYDGSGPFHIKGDDIPLYAQIIHIADWADIEYDLKNIDNDNFEIMINHINSLRNIQFSDKIVDAFVSSITFQKIEEIRKHGSELLKNKNYQIFRDFSNSQLLSICHLFAKIIDSKSPHTRSHSVGVATIATKLAQYYQYDSDMIMKIFFAGVMHDVGKLIISRDVLEKPEKLTNQEYAYIQNHAYYTYKILSDMELGDIVEWASYHHEKLDGAGYPFGKKADDLDFNSRMIACCDIYQALRENRPYKKAMSHKAAIDVMRSMAESYKIDGKIVEDMDVLFKNTNIME